ncbi:Glutaredoxin [Musa troglodytarum]|uniref:Glutaredoxin n=1 Tax=Musa troglodytarum TaxID=320322 RepID=A0A9E7H9R4_9LILI|nr:Glutaredoxin [Musa troglodytarum]
MCHVARRLLLGLGVNPTVCEFGDEAAGEAAGGGDVRRLAMLPVVFVGGRLLGGLDRLVAVHITGELVPILKEAGALWL